MNINDLMKLIGKDDSNEKLKEFNDKRFEAMRRNEFEDLPKGNIKDIDPRFYDYPLSRDYISPFDYGYIPDKKSAQGFRWAEHPDAGRTPYGVNTGNMSLDQYPMDAIEHAKQDELMYALRKGFIDPNEVTKFLKDYTNRLDKINETQIYPMDQRAFEKTGDMNERYKKYYSFDKIKQKIK